MGAPDNLVFAVTGMHCASCGLLIDDAVEEIVGVERCQTDARRGRTVVTTDPAVVTVDAIVAAIVDAGYTAEMVASSAVAPRRVGAGGSAASARFPAR